MIIARSTEDTLKGPDDWFTGDGYVDMVKATQAPSRIRAVVVHFTPGARTFWHTHPVGQTILVTEGVGLCQREGGPVEVIRPRRQRLLRAQREPLARRGSQPLHGPRWHAG